MLKKFYEWNFFINEYKDSSYLEEKDNYYKNLLNEATQGNVTKETIPHLFSDDTIKFLYQFNPDYWDQAEYERYQILYEAMEKRQAYYNDFLLEYIEEEKQKLIKIFDEQKEMTKIYFSNSLAETIINHCARKAAFEKINTEKINDWWNDTSENGGNQYLKPDFSVKVGPKSSKTGEVFHEYKINLFLKEMIKRIEKDPNSSSGADLSFPQEWHVINSRSGKNETIKRFAGMLLPTLHAIQNNITIWKNSVANNMLSTENPEHGVTHHVTHLKAKKSESPLKAEIKYTSEGKENIELYEIEEAILTKELRRLLDRNNWVFEEKENTKLISKLEKELTSLPEGSEKTGIKERIKSLLEKKKGVYNAFIIDFKNTFQFAQKVFENIDSSFKISDGGKIVLNNPQIFFDKIVNLDAEDRKALSYIGSHIEGIKSEGDKKKKKDEDPRIKYNKVIDAAKKDFIDIFKDQTLANSFNNLMVTKQLLDWVRDKNIKSFNPITKEEEYAEIDEDGNVKFPKVYMPTFSKHVTFTNNKNGEEVTKEVSMPLLIAGKILKEKSREELLQDDKEEDTGAGMWNPYHGKYQKRYFDRSKDIYAGIQGQEDKIKGGLRPNQNIESFEFMCPSENDKEKLDNFWSRLKKIITENGNLSTVKVKTSSDLKTLLDKDVPKEDKEHLYPELIFNSGSSGSLKEKNTVITGIAEIIWNYLKVNIIEDQKSLTPERIIAASNFINIYNLIMSKILSNIGDVEMMDKKYLKKFIIDKMQLFTQQNLIPERKGRATRNEDPKEGDKLKSFEDPDKILQKGYATYNIEKYVNALQQYALHLCRKPAGEDVISCGKCVDPIDGKCEIFMDGEEYKNDLHKILRLLKEHGKLVRKGYKNKKSVSASPVISRTAIAPPSPTLAPPSPTLAPPSPTLVPSSPTPTPTPSVLPAAKAAPVGDLTSALPQEKEYIMHIEKEVMELLVKRMLSSMENERLKLAQKRYQKMKDAYEDDYMSDEKKDELIEAHEKEYNDLIKGLESDKESLKLKLSKFKNEIQDFQTFVNSIIKTYNMKDIEEGISKDKV